jgi:hypothetical protein
MFDLNEAITSWCARVAESSNLSRIEIEELHDHLATEVHRQQSLGASDEEAFALAAAKLGNVDSLASEYAKNKKLGRTIRAVANLPYGKRILGAYLLTIACLMSFTHSIVFIELFVIGADRSADFAGFTVVDFLGLSVWMWAPFVWGGLAGAALLRGRDVGAGRLLALAALLAVQIPVFGAAPLPAFELSGGLQLTLLFGATDTLLEYQTLPDIHINAPAGPPYYFGISLLALIAFLFTAAQFLDSVARTEARTRAAQALG